MKHRPEGSHGKAVAVAKAASKSQRQPPPEGVAWETSWDVVSDQEHPDSALQEQVTLLGERLLQMEGLMQQMIQHLSQSSQAA